MSLNRKEYITVLYADGAYSQKRNVGGYAFLLQYLKWNKELELYELIKELSFNKTIENTTNNRMELLAAIEGLKALKKPCEVQVISDSTYVVDTINKWIDSFIDDKNRLNYDLMLELKEAMKMHDVTAIWIRGHTGLDIKHERVNELAQRAAGTWKEIKRTVRMKR